MFRSDNDRLPDLTRMVVRLRDGGRCVYCGRKAAFRKGHVDHLTPRSWCGSDEVENLAWSCIDCNQRKGTCDLEAFAGMVYRYGFRPIARRFASAADMVATVRQATGQIVSLEAAKAALAAEK